MYYQIVICDDEEFYREELKKLVAVYTEETGNAMNIKEFSSGEDLLEYMKTNKPFDIYFLDVEMEGMSGVKVAEQLRESIENLQIIFATSYEKYAMSAYDNEAIGYLVKPVSYMKFKTFVNKAIIQVDFMKDVEAAKRKYMEIKIRFETIRIETQDILYIEKRRNRSIIHTKKQEYTCYETLKQLAEKLDKNQFVYTHQGYIVNFKEIKEVDKQAVIFAGHVEVPLSRSCYKDIKNRFDQELDKIRLEKRKEQYIG